MQPFRFAHAGDRQADWESLAAACLAQLTPLPPQANLGFVYASDALAGDLAELLGYLQAQVPGCHWIGTVGMGICATGQEYHEIPALAVMLGEFPAGSFQVFSTLHEELEDFQRYHADWYDGKQAIFGVVHGDPRNPQVPLLARLLAIKLNEGFLVGGLSSSRAEHFQIADGITEGGLSGVLFSNQVAVMTRLSQGCTPLGKRHEITHCEHNVIQRLDGRPALDVFKEDIGPRLADDLEKVAGYIFAGLPIPGTDTGEYLVRNLVGIDPEHKLLAIGELVQPGQTIMFTKRDRASAQRDLQRMLENLRDHLPHPPRGGIYISCLGRGQYLFGEHSEELRQIREVLGDFPLVGFFANGEISHTRLHGYTGVLSVFL
jgi:small ligand-binding sensory domain FIST